MKNKKILAMIASVALIAAIGIGATLAYLSDKTKVATNTFTVGDIDIELTEPNWNPDDAEQLTAGAEVSKDPTVTNTGANAAHVVVKISGMDAMRKVGFECDFDADSWAPVNEEGVLLAFEDDAGTAQIDESKFLKDGYYIYKGTDGILAVGEKTPPLFSTVIFNGDEIAGTYSIKAVLKDNTAEIDYYMIEGVSGETFATYDEAEAYIFENYPNDAVNRFELNVQAFAVQTSGSYTFADTTTWVPLALDAN